MNFEKWLNQLKELWLNKDVKSIVNNLYEREVIYYETPFQKIDDVINVWNDILEQNILSLEYKIMGILDNTVTTNFIMKLDNGYICDMVYEIKLNENNKYTYFKQWYMGKNKNEEK